MKMDTLIEYWKDMFKWNYTATRKQYWVPTIVYSLLYNLLFYSTGIVIVGPSYLDFTNVNSLVAILGIALFIAQITLTVRRLHDTNRSGAWLLIGLLPIVGWIILVVMLCQPAKTSDAKDYSNQMNQSAEDAVRFN